MRKAKVHKTKRKTYSDEFVKRVLFDKHCGMTITTICKEYNLSKSQANYILYIRGATLTVDDFSPDFSNFNNKTEKHAAQGSEPPSTQKKVWSKVKSVLGFA